MDASDNFLFEQGGRELLPRVKPLWEQLNRHHLARSTWFKQHYSSFTFEKRRQKFQEDAGLSLLVDIILDPSAKKDVGYCLTSLDAHGAGEIESLYIEPACRHMGLGEKLVERALAWLQSNHASQMAVTVAEGNEEVFPFYRRFGFYPRKTYLQYIPPDDQPPEG